jgi:mono/diheme cytochrome c family protein
VVADDAAFLEAVALTVCVGADRLPQEQRRLTSARREEERVQRRVDQGKQSGNGAHVRRVTAFVGALALCVAGCSDGGADRVEPARAPAPESKKAPAATAAVPKQAPASTVALTPEELIAEGRSTYNANCIACHAMDPTLDGALGPAVAGASPELIEARVLRGEYPAGYSPKRTSRVMVALPHLEPKLPALAAYLGSL